MTKRKRKSTDPCGPPRKGKEVCPKPGRGKLDTYLAIVKDYIESRGSSPDEVLEFYREQKTLKDALKLAAYAKTRNGKLHPHQYKLDKTVYAKIHTRLKQRNLEQCETFHELFQLVEDAILSIDGVGALMVYDTAHRLGAYLGLRPEYVYIHAGAKIGAKALGVRRKPWISRFELPQEFRRLKPEQVEDCLCIYKDELKRIQGDNP